MEYWKGFIRWSIFESKPLFSGVAPFVLVTLPLSSLQCPSSVTETVQATIDILHRLLQFQVIHLRFHEPDSLTPILVFRNIFFTIPVLYAPCPLPSEAFSPLSDTIYN